jgi:uncharacterized protein (TIGR02145 family)
MKNILKYIPLFVILSFQGCSKYESVTIPELSTYDVTDITDSSATCGGKIISDKGTPILMKGVCWSEESKPTTLNFNTQDGDGNDSFTSLLTKLKPSTKYYIRAYATNKIGTGYGNEVQFTTSTTTPIIKTEEIFEISYTYAKCKSNLISDGGFPIISKGICWSTSDNPTINDSKTIESTTIGEFTSILTNLKANTTYYIRSYATNSLGINYGNSLSFTTKTAQIIHDIDGNSYQAIQIGTQFWLDENLKVTHYSNGDSIPFITDNTGWKNAAAGAYCYYDNTSSNGNMYGALYNWFTVEDVRNLCPTGWHVPNETDWSVLIDFLSGKNISGGKLKITLTEPEAEPRWDSPNTGATNESGFSGLPSGFRDHNGNFLGKGKYVYFWYAEAFNPDQSNYKILSYNNSIFDVAHQKKSYGASVRCVKDSK